MNKFYAKTILYAYANISSLITQIDELVEKKALTSMYNFSPAINQYEEIVELSEQKIKYLNLKENVKEVLKKFDEEELKCLDYKYFKHKPKSEYRDFDSSSRQYFRKQNKIAQKFGNFLEKKGINDVFFQREYLSIGFFKELLKRVIEHEEKSFKNKKKIIGSTEVLLKKTA